MLKKIQLGEAKKKVTTTPTKISTFTIFSCLCIHNELRTIGSCEIRQSVIASVVFEQIAEHINIIIKWCHTQSLCYDISQMIWEKA